MPWMAMPPSGGDVWLVGNCSDFAHSVVYADAGLVAPRADRSGEVVALYAGGLGEDVDERRFTLEGECVISRG